MGKKKKLRKLGVITQDMEPYLLEMAIDHDLQRHEIHALIDAYLIAHTDCIETYVSDNSKSVMYIGHWSGLK